MIASPSIMSVFPASTDSAVAPAARIACIVATPTTGTSNRMSCFGLATLTMRTPGPARCPARRNDLVGAFHRLDGDDRLMLHRDRLPDVQRRDRVGHAVAELEILLLLAGRRPSRQHAWFREQRRDERRGVDELDAVVAQHGGHGADQTVGVPPAQLGEDGKQRRVRNDVGEDFGVLHLPRHHGMGHAGLLQHLDAGAELPERDPVDVALLAAGGLVQLGEGFFLERRRP